MTNRLITVRESTGFLKNYRWHMYAAVARRLEEHQKYLLASHIHPDGDAIGSLIALGAALKNCGKTVTLYNEHEVPPAYRFLPGSQMIVRNVEHAESYDALIVLDCSKIERIGNLEESLGDISVINIDHHCSNKNFGGIQIVEPEASATAEIIYRLVKAMGCEISNEIAYAIYTGIITD